MGRKRRIGPVLPAALLIAVSPVLALGTVPIKHAFANPAPGEKLVLSPARPRQGEALFIRLQDSTAGNPTVVWRGRSYPLYRQDDGWTGVVPVPPDTPAGGHTLRIDTGSGDCSGRLERKVEVAPVKFPIQYLKMASKTARLYNYPGVEVEERTIGTAIRAQSDQRLWGGDWALPAKGRLSTPFGVRRLRNGKHVGRHRGVDIAAPTGTPIMAPATGRVVLAGKFRKHGNTVVLDHGHGLTSLYIHMSAISVREGQTLLKGARIGRVGSTGVSTGPHLHWAVYSHGEPIQPLLFCRLSKRGIRY
jgi:peptidase M23-like protein